MSWFLNKFFMFCMEEEEEEHLWPKKIRIKLCLDCLLLVKGTQWTFGIKPLVLPR